MIPHSGNEKYKKSLFHNGITIKRVLKNKDITFTSSITTLRFIIGTGKGDSSIAIYIDYYLSLEPLFTSSNYPL